MAHLLGAIVLVTAILIGACPSQARPTNTPPTANAADELPRIHMKPGLWQSQIEGSTGTRNEQSCVPDQRNSPVINLNGCASNHLRISSTSFTVRLDCKIPPTFVGRPFTPLTTYYVAKYPDEEHIDIRSRSVSAHKTFRLHITETWQRTDCGRLKPYDTILK